jgi:arginyl-tRNA synthetase
LKNIIESLLQRAMDALPPSILPRAERGIDIEVQAPRDSQHGDFASNVALRLATAGRRNPRRLAEALARALPADPAVDKVEIAGSGFINFFLTDSAYHGEIARLLADRPSRAQAGPRQIVELILPSPTGRLHVGHGRLIVYATALANLLDDGGHGVLREYRLEPAGRPGAPDRDPADIRRDLEQFGLPVESGHGPAGPGANDGDELRLCVSSADRAGPGGPRGGPEMCRVESVRLLRGGRKTPARPGEELALRDLIEEVGEDAARLCYVSRSHDRLLDFDLDLAQERGNDNPLYCIQYAHARVSSLRRQLADRGLAHDAARGLESLGRLAQPEERILVRRSSSFTQTIEHCALHRAPHLLVRYLVDLANDVHAYDRAHRLIVDDPAVRHARLTLAYAAQAAIRKGLELVGASAPDTM